MGRVQKPQADLAVSEVLSGLDAVFFYELPARKPRVALPQSHALKSPRATRLIGVVACQVSLPFPIQDPGKERQRRKSSSDTKLYYFAEGPIFGEEVERRHVPGDAASRLGRASFHTPEDRLNKIE